MSAHSHNPLPYRSDIDGLRAFAVMSVVLYHFGLPLQGGFVGVDIFFVISGFLIGGILWREYDATGRINLLAFYTRRFKRLAPAFFTMVAVTAVLGWAILLPFEYREFGKAVIAATIYLSNILFYRQTGYFDTVADEKPLLHTWSLAVEEQFYIFLPLCFLLLLRWRWGLIGALICIWITSLAACILLTPSYPSAAFYLFPFRAWELLSGVLLAIWGHETQRPWRGHPALSWIGLGLITASVCLIPAGPGFPGLVAVAPVLGTVLLLSSGTGDNSVNRMLSQRHVVFLGLISYSLYLWHWPIYTLSTYLRDGHANLLESLAWMALSIGVAWLAWRCVETPVRHARRLPKAAVIGGTALASAGAMAFGGWIFIKDGLPDRFGPEARSHIAATSDFLQDWSRCTIAHDLPLDGLEICPIGPEGTPRVLVWGDSHVRAVKEGLDLAAHDANVPGLIIWRAGCPPVFDLRKVESAATPAQNTACTQANLQIKQAFSRLPDIETVLLVGRWSYYASGTGTGLDEGNTITLHPTAAPAQAGKKQTALLSQATRSSIEHLRDWVPNLYVLRQPPEIPHYDSRKAAREAAHASTFLAPRPVTQAQAARADLEHRAQLADAPWQAMARDNMLTLLDPWPYFCDESTCSALHDGIGQYFDNNHLTNSAALRMRDLFTPVFAAASQQANMSGLRP